MAKTPARIILFRTNSAFEDVLEDAAGLSQKDFASHNARLYWKSSVDRTPKWVENIFPGENDLHERLKTRSISAVLLIRRSDKLFGITFGFGKTLLRQETIEPRFGLKVVLNRVDPESLRSIDTKSLDGFLSQNREQVPSLSPMSSFGIDIEKDFIKAVTGISKTDVIGKTITGTDSFYASVNISLVSLPGILDSLSSAFVDQTYKDNFEFVDNIAEVPKSLIDQLNDALVRKIIEGDSDRIWLAPPEIMDWGNHGGFSFDKTRGGTIYDDISLDTYILEKVHDLPSLDIDRLKRNKVICLSADFNFESVKWSVFSCLYAEIDDDGKKYILSDGKWFEVDTSYVQRVKQYVDGKLDEWQGAPFPEYETGRMALLDEDGLRGEALYNSEVSDNTGYTLMDAKLIIHGGANSKIELCDLYDEDLFIHIKRYTRSAGLSHLFNQGRVSAELLLSDSEFRDKARAKIIENGGTTSISAPRPKMEDVHIVFGIVSSSSGQLKIPFFSQVALKNSLHFLKNTLNVGKVSLVKIQATDE